MDTTFDERQKTRLQINSHKWVRSEDGWIAGVCEGLGNNFGIAPNLLRICWLASIFLFGTGILAYILLAIALPREDSNNHYEDRVLGVCTRLSIKSGMDVGLVRFLALLFGVTSLGLAFLIYLVLHFILTDSKPY